MKKRNANLSQRSVCADIQSARRIFLSLPKADREEILRIMRERAAARDRKSK